MILARFGPQPTSNVGLAVID